MFPKDILLFDVETTSVNPELADPIQISALLLDKDTLAEKDYYSSYIRSDLKDADPVSLAVSGISPEVIKEAPDRAAVGQEFVERFGFEVILASWVEHLDRRMLHKIIKSAGTNIMNYDYHYFDLWPLAYGYLIRKGYAGDMGSESIFQALGMSSRSKHDALEDCRYEAEILRKIIFEQ